MQKLFFLLPALVAVNFMVAGQTLIFDFAAQVVRSSGLSESGRYQIQDSLVIRVVGIDTAQALAIKFLNGNQELFKLVRDSLSGQFWSDGVQCIVEGDRVRGFQTRLTIPFRLRIVYRNLPLESPILFIPKGGENPDIGVGIANHHSSDNEEEERRNDNYYVNTKGVMEPFKDAVSINALLARNQTMVVEIMEDYFDTEKPVNWDNLKSVVEAHEELHLLHLLIKDMDDMAASQSGMLMGMKGSHGAFGSTLADPTIVIDGLARFIAERFKEELSIAYLDKMKNALKDAHMDKLLPQTYAILTSGNIVYYKSFLGLLREALHNDYVHAPDNLFTYFDSLPSDFHFRSDPTLYNTVMSGLYLLKRRGDAPADILEDLAGEEFVSDSLVKSVTAFLAALSRNLRADATYTGWVRSEELAKLREGNTFQIFAALFFMKEKEKLAGNHILETLTMADDAGLRRFFRLCNSILDIQKAFEALNGDRSLTVDSDGVIRAHIARAEALGNGIIGIFDLAHDAGMMDAQKHALYTSLLYQSTGIIKAAYYKDYSNVIQSIAVLIKGGKTESRYAETFMKYSAFALNLLTAESAEDAKIALETAAMPVGSYRVKRRSAMSVAFNSYPGGFLGIETFRQGAQYMIAESAFMAESQTLDQSGFGSGFTAPVGVSLDFGSGDSSISIAAPHAWNIFISIIDIGAVAALRLQDNISTLPELKWENVLAPGLSIGYGFRNSPLTIRAGAQYGPNLRELHLVTDTAQVEQTFEAPAWRVAVALNVDIPLLSVYAGDKGSPGHKKQNKK